MKQVILALAAVFVLGSATYATDTLRNKEKGGYLFTIVKDIEANEVQNQSRSGTCWSFSALSFIESELMRMDKGKHKLSEMYIVRNAYADKADKYVRMHGTVNFSAGGAFHDIPHVIKKHGIVPQEAYKGLNYGSEKHDHGEIDRVLKAVVDALIKGRRLTTGWEIAVNGVLDAYLGEVPGEFEYNGKKYTAESFTKSLGMNMDDYVYISSFTHHPYYSKFILEVPDNWAWGEVHNVPMDELVQIMDDALMNDYSIAWAADVSEKGFSFRDGLAIVPENEDLIKKRGKDNKHFSDAGAKKEGSAFDEPCEEKKITQEMRQKAFDNYETTDDHGMHCTGIVKDQNGKKYYLIKNSWGTKGNDCDGYFFASEAYVRYKTIDIMLHKDALSKGMKKKLGIN